MKSAWKILSSIILIYLVSYVLLQPTNQVASTAAAQEPEEQEFFVSQPVEAGVSPEVSSLSAAEFEPLLEREINPRHNPLLLEPDMGKRGTWERKSREIDPLIATSQNTELVTPPLDLSFDGSTGCNGCSPPDVVGDVGPNHYVSMVNVHFSIFDKSGNLLTGPTAFNALFNGQGGNCESQNAGDPIPLYDPLVDRWLLSQFAQPSHMCIAISQTPDPTGSYHLYEFDVGSFPDYFKFGVWPDGYYMSANENSYTAYAFDRVNMLAGNAATFQKFTGGTNLYLPSDLDGATSPPAGSPNYFYTFKDDSYHGGGSDRVEIREFDVDWSTPSNTTFTLVQSINMASFTYTPCGFFNFNCIHQQGTSQRFDALGEWPMFRFPYRNFGTHEVLVGTFSVGGGLGEVGSAIRWFELRDTGSGWTLYQEGTHDPGDGHDRMNASIAMDGSGNIALGYAVSSSSMYPSIHYATRLASDPLGTLQTEAILITGGGSQTASSRWGDYSAMSVDPANDCSFWHTNEYYPTSSGSGWRTRVGVFTLPECGTPDFSVSATPSTVDVCVDDSASTTIDVSSIGGFSDPVTLSASGLPANVTASFSSNPVNPPASSTLTFTANASASAGSSNIDVTGSASTSHTTSVQLNVLAGAPSAPTLTSPADGASDVSTIPTLSWAAATGASSYEIEIATDAGFSNIVDSATVASTSYTPSSLNTETVYYWRVTAQNGCGESAASSIFSFTTQATPPSSLVCNGAAIDFESGIPNDWTVTDDGTVFWTTTADSANCGIGNNTNATGEAACADSDITGSGSPPYSTDLLTPLFDLPTSLSAATLDFSGYFRYYGTSQFDVDVWASGTWVNLLSWTTTTTAEPSLDLSPYIGQSGLQVRFRYAGDGWDYYSQVDDVMLNCTGSPPVIEVEPDNLASSQAPDQQIAQSFDISNTGDGDLTWSIAEDSALTEQVITDEGHVKVDAADREAQMEAFLADQRQAQELETMARMAATPCVAGDAGGYPCNNVDLLAFMPLADIGGGNGNDIWGWTDSQTGKEYAIMGRTNGTAFVDISDPENPIYLGNLPTHTYNSSWRDIKVYNNHAFIVSEASGHGMQVFDLTQLASVTSPPATFSNTAHYSGFGNAHNIVINEDSGFAYAVGTSTCSGGLHIVDISTPTSPTNAGCFSSDGYTHDAQCVMYSGPDTTHQGKEICFNSNEDTLTIVDVTNKGTPVQLSRTGYSGSAYTHQGWLTEDQSYFLLDDELDESNQGVNTRTRIWDVSVLDAPTIIGIYDGPTSAIDHNLYVKDNYVYEANYRAGLRILDASDVANGNLNEVAYFDIYPSSDSASFNGAWSSYPYFDSGVVIVSGIEQGLFILQPNFGPPPPPATCDAPTDIPWASVSPASGTTTPANSTTVDVTFDSTGLATGTYTGTLCINSNDPVTPQVEVPLAMTVEESSNEPVISDIRQSNVRDVSFTVSWLTDVQSTGELHYGTDPNNLDQTAVDVRGAGTSDDTHYVTVSGLQADTTYYFDVVSANTTDDNGGAHHSLTTGPTLNLPGSDTINGQVFKEDGTTLAEGTIVYMTLNDANGAGTSGQAALLSSLVNSAGYWGTSLGNARTADLSDYFDYSASGDRVGLEAIGGADGVGCERVDTANDSPATDIVLNVSDCTVIWSLSIEAGWNHISLPIDPLTPLTAADLCSDINAQGGDVTEINRWHNGGWNGHICGVPFNNFDILLGSSYFIKSTTSSTWELIGNEISAPIPLDIQFGWNSIGIPHTDAYSAESLCDEIIDQGVTAVEIDRWHLGGWDGHLCGYSFNDFNIESGVGYFVKASSSGTVIPNAPATPLQQPTHVVPALTIPVGEVMAVRHLHIGNLTDSAVTLSWLTDGATTGYVLYGETPELGQVALDVRGAAVEAETHLVTLTNLKPETSYYFKVVSGLEDESAPQMLTTAPSLSNVPASDTVYGRVFLADGMTPATGAVVHLTLQDNDDTGSTGSATLLSAVVDEEGYWQANLGNARAGDLLDSFSYSATGDELLIEVQGAGTASLTVDTSNDAQAPDIMLTSPTSVALASFDTIHTNSGKANILLAIALSLAIAGYLMTRKGKSRAS